MSKIPVLRRPYSRIGLFHYYLEGQSQGSRCSAFLVAPRVALTAAHCVYECDKAGRNCRKFAKGTVYFRRFGKGNKFDQCEVPVVSAKESVSYFNYPVDNRHDYAALYFPHNINVYDRCFFDKKFPLKLGFDKSVRTIRIVGYPAFVPATLDKAEFQSTQFYEEGGAIAGGGFIEHKLSTTGGNSGGPILAWSGDQYIVVGITSGGFWRQSNKDVYFNASNRSEIVKLINKGN